MSGAGMAAREAGMRGVTKVLHHITYIKDPRAAPSGGLFAAKVLSLALTTAAPLSPMLGRQGA